MASRVKDIKFKATGGDFIDQFDTGSYIRYKAHVTVTKGKTPDLDYLNIDFNMSLGDCTRVINWDFEDYDDDELKFDKVNAAIKILENVRGDMIKMSKVIKSERLRIDVEKKNAAKKKGVKKDGN